MPVGTSDGKYYDSDFDYWHEQMFGKQEPEEEQKNNLFLVRHGDTADNDEDIIHGWVNTPLNDKGIEQAHKAADSLKDKDITRIISSDLPRAKQTANIIANKLGVPVEFRPELRTWNTGDFDGTQEHDELKKYTSPKNNTKDLVKRTEEGWKRYDVLSKVKKDLIDSDVKAYPTEEERINTMSKYPYNEYSPKRLTSEDKEKILQEIENYGKDPYIIPGEYDVQTNQGIATVI